MIDEGAQQKALSIAKNMLKENMSINLISKVTGLTEDEIKELKKIDN